MGKVANQNEALHILQLIYSFSGIDNILNVKIINNSLKHS